MCIVDMSQFILTHTNLKFEIPNWVLIGLKNPMTLHMEIKILGGKSP